MEKLACRTGGGVGVNDTIYRQAAIDAMEGLPKYFDKTGTLCLDYADVLAVLSEHLPSAETERKTGYWIEITPSNHTYKCSVCGRLLVNITDGKNNVAKNYPYCHCGADMRGEENE